MDLRRVLSENDRSRPLHDDEFERLVERLGIGATTLIDLEPHDKRRNTRARQRVLLVAAATALVVGLAAMSIRQDSQAIDAADPSPTILPPPSCPVEVDAVVDALDRWGGVELWVWGDETDPDLGAAIVEALEVLGISQEAETLRSELELGLQTGGGSDRDRRERVVVASLDTLKREVKSRGLACDLDGAGL